MLAFIGAGANTTVYGVSVAVDDKKAWSWKGALAAGLGGGTAGATTAATWGLGIPALPAPGINFAGGAFARRQRDQSVLIHQRGASWELAYSMQPVVRSQGSSSRSRSENMSLLSRP